MDVDDQQILSGENVDALLINGVIFGRTWFGCMYVRTRVVQEEDAPLMKHLAEMQWIPVDFGV